MMISKHIMEKIWLTMALKGGIWVIIAFVLALGHSRDSTVCQPWFPFWLELWGWSIVVTGLALGLVQIWLTED